MAWHDEYLTQKWDKRFLNYAKKMFSFNDEMTQAAYGYANEEFFKWAKSVNEIDAARFTDGYCIAKYKSALVNYHRHQFGRFRPFKWVNEKGEPWPKIAMLVAQNCSLQEIQTTLIEALKDKEDKEDKYNIPYLREIVEQLFQRPYGEFVPLDKEEGDFAKDRTAPPNQLLIDQERLYFVNFLIKGKSDTNELPITVVKKWQALSEALNLSDDARLVLKLRFYEVKSKSYREIAEILSELPNSEENLPILWDLDPKTNVKTLKTIDTREKAIERLVKDILEKMRLLFAQEGIRFDDL